MVHDVIEAETANNPAQSGVAEGAVADARFPGAGLNLLVVILCYRVVELTIACLQALVPQVRALPKARITVCENGTGAEAVDQLHRAIVANGWSDCVSLLAVSPNVGFTGGNNAVLRPAMNGSPPPRYFLLLNADTVVQPGAVKRLYDAMEQAPQVGIMGSLMIGPDGEMQMSCFRDHSPVSEFLRGVGSGRINRLLLRNYNFHLAPPSGATRYDWVSFACAMIRSHVLRDVGPLDEGYFLYYDDADYCRMARKAGWAIGYCELSQVVHLEGQSNELPEKARYLERKPRYYYVSRARYFGKHIGRIGLWAANVAWSVGSLVSVISRSAGGRGARPCLGEWRDIWTNACAPVRKSDAALLPEESHVVV